MKRSKRSRGGARQWQWQCVCVSVAVALVLVLASVLLPVDVQRVSERVSEEVSGRVRQEEARAGEEDEAFDGE
jgi:hypothetical protein